MYRSHVLVCGGTGCTSSGSQQIMETLKTEIEKNGLSEEATGGIHIESCFFLSIEL